MTAPRPQRLLLLGGGHAQLAVLQALAQQRPANVEVVLVTPAPRQVYSGMLPGWLAGHYTEAQCVIALAPLAEAAGVTLRRAAAVGLDAAARTVRLDDGGVLGYDVLSVNTGPVQDPAAWGVPGQTAVPTLRPIEDWLARTTRRLAEVPPRRVVVVGGGAAGFELALAWRHRLEAAAEVSIVTGRSGLLANYPAAVRRLGRQALAARGVRCIEAAAREVSAEAVVTADGQRQAADEVVLAVGTVAPRWLQGSGLALAPDGGLATRATLQSVSHPEVFAAGDVASRLDGPLPKSGVYAVRAGAALAENVLGRLAGRAPQPWAAPVRTLNLLSLGERSAIAAWGPLAVQGRWVWRWKDRIDRGFMARHGTHAKPAAT
ncbi:FAD-dependent oxidoreductase [Sphaerotilus sp.]|uniref:FAD-dependent oxidoreductase n=1 Tax=Sphaerotilus sp. TaxID=2093942 RepID=UPI002ACD9781|nr:FAD-dependent oxidoreductase [Sphaerotilus sp.]MDZ7855661.1 FAD-dependent oxidoreductase [Sphaerotilus sp.]